jgi:lipopolysaccharide/colanic/teichoic acid biosynthesis glycosyltransferase
MLKRIIDAAASVLLVVILSPLLITVSILVFINLGGPIFFRQQRLGLNGKPFKVLKFRTMKSECDETGALLPDEVRLTRLGKLLRKFSIDELPSLINVLKGEMSLVGPRPQDARFMEKCNAYQHRRHEVKPGITGWAQINGRNAISWEERFELDVWYVDNRSLLIDLKIVIMTVPLVLLAKDVTAPGHATMPAFQGTKHRPQASSRMIEFSPNQR